MKKTIVVLLIAALAVASAFAGRGALDLTAGAIVQWNGDLGTAVAGVTDGDGNFDWEKAKQAALNPAAWQIGAEARAKIALLELDSAAMFSKIENGKGLIISGYVTGGLSMDLLGLARLGLTIGPDVYYYTAPEDVPDGSKQFSIGTMGDTQARKFADYQAENPEASDFVASLMTAPLNLRATTDFLVGSVTIGVSVTVPTNLSFYKFNFLQIIPTEDAILRSRVAISAGIAIL
jgi:hypothetical protein